jgi:hypothetical protein
MAHHRPAPSTSLRGKQAAVQEGQFLQFLRSVGYRDELPPSTVAWLETAPVFKFLAGKLSADNFVSAQDQQEYNECMLARGPDASLYDAVGDGLSSDGGGDGGEGGGGGAAARAAETDPFLAGLTDDEVAAALQVRRSCSSVECSALGPVVASAVVSGVGHTPRIRTAALTSCCCCLQEEEVYVQRLEQQVASLRAMSGALSSTAQQAAEQQGPRYFTLKAHAGERVLPECWGAVVCCGTAPQSCHRWQRLMPHPSCAAHHTRRRAGGRALRGSPPQQRAQRHAAAAGGGVGGAVQAAGIPARLAAVRRTRQGGLRAGRLGGKQPVWQVCACDVVAAAAALCAPRTSAANHCVLRLPATGPPTCWTPARWRCTCTRRCRPQAQQQQQQQLWRTTAAQQQAGAAACQRRGAWGASSSSSSRRRC